MKTSLLLRFLREHRLAVQASVSPDSRAQAAVVGFGVSDRFEIVFDTVDSTRKARNLRANPQVALVIGGLLPAMSEPRRSMASPTSLVAKTWID